MESIFAKLPKTKCKPGGQCETYINYRSKIYTLVRYLRWNSCCILLCQAVHDASGFHDAWSSNAVIRSKIILKPWSFDDRWYVWPTVSCGKLLPNSAACHRRLSKFCSSPRPAITGLTDPWRVQDTNPRCRPKCMIIFMIIFGFSLCCSCLTSSHSQIA